MSCVPRAWAPPSIDSKSGIDRPGGSPPNPLSLMKKQKNARKTFPQMLEVGPRREPATGDFLPRTRSLDRLRQILRMEPERPRSALVKNTSALADQIQTIRPTGIRQLNLVVNPIYQCRKVDPQLAHASIRHTEPLRLIRRTAEQNVVFHVRLHLPYVGRDAPRECTRHKNRSCPCTARPACSGREPPAEKAVRYSSRIPAPPAAPSIKTPDRLA